MSRYSDQPSQEPDQCSDSFYSDRYRVDSPDLSGPDPLPARSGSVSLNTRSRPKTQVPTAQLLERMIGTFPTFVYLLETLF